MTRDLTDLIDERQKKRLYQPRRGTILSVGPAVAQVQRDGPGAPISCQYDPGQGVEVGKRCVVSWAPGRQFYISGVFNVARSINPTDQLPENFELSPPANLVATSIPDCVLLTWAAPPQQIVLFEVQSNATATEVGATTIALTRGSVYIDLPGDVAYYRVRSVTTRWRYSSWSAWVDGTPGAGGGGAGLTTEQVQDLVAAMVVAGSNVTATYNDGAGTLTLDAGGSSGGLTSEQVEDLVATLIVEGANISATYNDGAGTLTLAVTGLASTNLSDFAEAVDDRVNALLVEGANIDLTYNDGSNTLTIAVTGLDSGDLSDFSSAVLALLDAADTDYTPTTGADWMDPDPATVQEALDILAARPTGGFSGDASDVPYTPADAGDWSPDPTTVQEALDTLAATPPGSIDYLQVSLFAQVFG